MDRGERWRGVWVTCNRGIGTDPLLPTPYSLLPTRCSLLPTRCSLLAARYSLLATDRLLLSGVQSTIIIILILINTQGNLGSSITNRLSDLGTKRDARGSGSS